MVVVVRGRVVFCHSVTNETRCYTQSRVCDALSSVRRKLFVFRGIVVCRIRPGTPVETTVSDCP